MNPKRRIVRIALSGLCGVAFSLITLTTIATSYTSTGMPACAAAQQDDDWAAQRERMVRHQIEGRGLRDKRVLDAMRTVPRHEFVPPEYRRHAYDDTPLPIGREQTISQPFIVAHMTRLIELEPGEKVLEIGTGSGYQAAVLAEITDHVYSIEIDCVLAERAKQALTATGYSSVVTKCDDGYAGWTKHAPFDAIIVTAAAPYVPQPLLDQLAVGGVLVIPVGETEGAQHLMKITRTADGYREERLDWVRFVPMTGAVREKKPK